MRIAIITAYFKEDRAIIERCIESVRKQTVPVEHILVADGHPQEWPARENLRHIALDRNHADFGDTPRLVGLALAIRENFDAIQFLDADNLIYPHHAEMAIGLLHSTDAHMLVLKRHFLRPDGTTLNIKSVEDDALRTIDTNCYLFTRPAFPTAIKWSLIPRELSYMGDRVFRSMFSKAGHPVAVASEPTVGYTSTKEYVYRSAGEEPPPGCHDLSAHRMEAAAWWTGLDDAKRQEIEAMLGVKISIV